MQKLKKTYKRLTGLFVSQYVEGNASANLRDEDKERIINALVESMGKPTRLEYRSVASQFIKERRPTKELVLVIEGETEPVVKSQVDDNDLPF